MNGYKNLLIDLDDTLIKVNIHRARFDFVMRMLFWWSAYASPWKTFQALRALVASIKYSGMSNESNYRRGLIAFSNKINLPEGEVELLLNKSTNIVFEKLKKHFSPMKGAKEFILWAHKKYTLFLVTNPVWPPEIVKMRLKWAGLDAELFSSYTHSKRMCFCKSDLKFFEEFLTQERLNLRSCFMIGNNPNEDGNAAKLGIRTFLISKNSSLSFQTLQMILEGEK